MNNDLRIFVTKNTWTLDNETLFEDCNFFSKVAPDIDVTLELTSLMVENGIGNIIAEYEKIDDGTNALYYQLTNVDLKFDGLSDNKYLQQYFYLNRQLPANQVVKYAVDITYKNNPKPIFTGYILLESMELEYSAQSVEDIVCKAVDYSKEFTEYYKNINLPAIDFTKTMTYPANPFFTRWTSLTDPQMRFEYFDDVIKQIFNSQYLGGYEFYIGERPEDYHYLIWNHACMFVEPEYYSGTPKIFSWIKQGYNRLIEDGNSTTCIDFLDNICPAMGWRYRIDNNKKLILEARAHLFTDVTILNTENIISQKALFKTNKKYCDNIAIWAGNYLGWHNWAGTMYNFSSFYLLNNSGTFANTNFFNNFALITPNPDTGIALIRTPDEIYKNLHWTSSDDIWHYYELWGYDKKDEQINATFDNRTPEGFILNGCYAEYIGSSVSGYKIKLTTSSTATITHSISANGSSSPIYKPDYYLNYWTSTVLNGSSISAYLIHTGNNNQINPDPYYETLIPSSTATNGWTGTKNIHLGNLVSLTGINPIALSYDKLQFRIKKTSGTTSYVMLDNIKLYDNTLYENHEPHQITKESTMWIGGGSTGKLGFRTDTSDSKSSPFNTDMLSDPINLGEYDYAYFGNYAHMLSTDYLLHFGANKYLLETYEELVKQGIVWNNYRDLLKSNTLNKIEVTYDGILDTYEKILIKFIGNDSFLNNTLWTITSTEINYNDEISTIKLNKIMD